MTQQQTLTARQQAILPVGAFMSSGDMPRLHTALGQGLDAGLTVAEIKEILVQLYAYAGFPRSLNALGTFMNVLKEREARGVQDASGRAPGPLPAPEKMREVGRANQTRLAGAPVTGPLFDFAPLANEYLQAHLFGPMFSRDNLNWQDRELATVGALAGLQGVDSQLQAHMRISLNTGLTASQLRQAAEVLRTQVDDAAGQRAHAALERQLAAD
ncbi:MAG: carboxymuconolactone decarboxylase family protein [Pseudomonadota bacterium]|nr:carboxymuconolactone decarboxylase family protein [Pseudomonadota bacterium]